MVVNKWWESAPSKRNGKNGTSWIGQPLSRNNKPYDFFKTHKKDYPVKLFGDTDKDGVANVFDCKPNDPNQQGIISAIVGAVKGIAGGKGGIKRGWREGMAKPGVYKSVRAAIQRRREARVARPNVIKTTARPVRLPPSHEQQNLQRTLRGFRKVMGPVRATPSPDTLQEIETKQIDSSKPYGHLLENQIEDYNQKVDEYNTRQQLKLIKRKWDTETRESAPKGWQSLKRTVAAHPGLFMALRRANPKYNMAAEYRGKKIALLKKEMESLDPDSPRYKQKANTLEKIRLTQFKEIQRLKGTARSQFGKSTLRAIGMPFGILPMQQSKMKKGEEAMLPTYKVQGSPGQRGRPRGSLDPRYQAYGGVFGYRRAMSAQRRAFREQLKQQQEAMKMQRMIQKTPYEYTQPQMPQTQTQQVPQEVTGATPEYSQFQQIQQQYPYPQMPSPQLPEEPPPEMFKSFGGKPYPVVERRPLAPTRETIPQGFTEVTDAFTGRRYLKPLPKPERWSAG